MRRDITGEYEITSIAGEKIKAFIPHPLPPRPPLDLNKFRLKLLEKASLALGKLDSITLLLPDPNIFLYSYIRREAVLSSQIEGTQSSLADLLLYEIEETPGVPIDDVVEVSNYVAALEHGMERMQNGFPLSNRLLREMHKILLSKGRGSNMTPGLFRKTQNWIGGSRPGNAYFIPPPPHKVQQCMADLERFLHDENNPYASLVKAALSHVQFETIHPFLDGNGRIGRLLIAFILHHEQMLSKPLLYLSLYFKQQRSDYYRLLDLVRTNGDWESWLDFFLEGVEYTASNAVDTAKQLVNLLKEDEQKVQQLGGLTPSARLVFQSLSRHPLVNVHKLSKLTGLQFPTVNKIIKRLELIGIVKEITGRQRNRVFTYPSYLNILKKGTDP